MSANALEFCIAFAIAADALHGGEGSSPAIVRSLCAYCVDDVDRLAECPVRRAPAHFNCLRCTCPRRREMGGVLLVTMPRAMPFTEYRG